MTADPCPAPRHGTRHAIEYWSCVCAPTERIHIAPPAPCRACGQVQHLHARSLCRRCYSVAHRSGQLTAYPVLRVAPRPRPIDPIAIERAVRGEPPPKLTATERRLAIAQLDRYRLPGREIARRLRVNLRTVVRHRAALRLEPAA